MDTKSIVAFCFLVLAMKSNALCQQNSLAIQFKAKSTSRYLESHCIKSIPLSGSPFTTMEQAVRRNAILNYPQHFTYGPDTMSYIYPRGIEKLDLFYTEVDGALHLVDDSIKVQLRSTPIIDSYFAADWFLDTTIRVCDTAISEYEYLITETLDHSADTALLRKVYNFLTSESDMRKFEANFNTTSVVSENILFRQVDTSMHYDCSANVDVVTIDTTYFNYDDLRLNYVLVVGYNSMEHCFRVDTKYIGLVRDVIDLETGVIKYQKPLGYLRKEDLIDQF